MRFRHFMIWVAFSSIFAPAAMAGNLDSPGLPSAGSGMYTLQGLYDYLLSGVTPSLSAVFLEPSAGPGSTGKTTREIYDGISAAFNAADATPDKVLSGSTFFSTDPANWGPRAGTIATQTPVDTTVSQAAGFYNAFDLSAVDTDLMAGNIKSGTDLFGIIGTVIQASGAAMDADVLSGVTYSNASGSSTGTMANNGAVSITPGTAAQSIAAGYHNGSGTVAGDANLITGNIKSGASIFGVAGKTEVVDTTTANPAAAGDIRSGKTAFVNGATVSGSMPTKTLSSASTTVTAGYYNATTLNAVDGDLSAGNIKSGVNVFGVTGSFNGVTCTGSLSPLGRWCDNGNGTVTDMNTGVVWLKNAGCVGSKVLANCTTYDDANTAATTIYDGATNFSGGDCALTDNSQQGKWRLPTFKDAIALVNGTEAVSMTSKYFFSNVQLAYWTGSTRVGASNSGWAFYMDGRKMQYNGKTASYFVWPVRD